MLARMSTTEVAAGPPARTPPGDVGAPGPSGEPAVTGLRPAWRAEASAQFRLAAPVVAVQVGMFAMHTVDVIMIGHVSVDTANQMAAVATGGLFAWLPVGLAMGVLTALDPLISQAAGARDEGAIARTLQRAVVLALLLSLPLAAILALVSPLMRVAGQSEAVIPIATSYVHWSIPGIPAFLLFVVFRQTLQATHRMRPIVIVIVIGNLLNLGLDWVLIRGALGFPALGATGCAIATSLGRWFMALGLLAIAWPVFGPWMRPFRRAALDRGPLLRMVRLGGPIGIQFLLEMGVFGFVTLAMGTIGPQEQAGHQVALSLASLSFMVPLGISMAASVRVGHAIGRRDHEGLRLASRVAICAGAGVMLVFATIFATVPELLARVYTDEAPVIAWAAALLPLAAAFQVFDGLQVVSSGILRGSGDTRVPMLLYLLGFWVVGLPLALGLGFGAGWGPRGLWTGLAGALAAVAVVLMARVRWRTATLPERVHVDEHER